MGKNELMEIIIAIAAIWWILTPAKYEGKTAEQWKGYYEEQYNRRIDLINCLKQHDIPDNIQFCINRYQ